MKVLILTSSFGGGHNSVARALKRALEENFSIEAKVEDIYHLMSPGINRINSQLYVYTMKYLPRLYGLFYQSTYELDIDNPLLYLFSMPGLGKLKELLEMEKPDGVVAVYPTFAGMLRILRERGFPTPKSFVVITDFVAHSQWLHNYMDAYFLPSEEVELHLHRKGVSCPRIEVSGIPINPEFDLFRKEERNVILISAGMFGMTPSLLEVCQVVGENVPGELQVVLLCGTDSRLCRRVKERFSRIRAVEGIISTRDMAELMGSAILLISKAGGITTSEALASETPMIVYKPLPGQEYHNAIYLLKKEAGLIANGKEELSRVIRLFFSKEELRKKMLDNIKRIRKPHSALTVARGIHDVLQREG